MAKLLECTILCLSICLDRYALPHRLVKLSASPRKKISTHQSRRPCFFSLWNLKLPRSEAVQEQSKVCCPKCFAMYSVGVSSNPPLPMPCHWLLSVSVLEHFLTHVTCFSISCYNANLSIYFSFLEIISFIF